LRILKENGSVSYKSTKYSEEPERSYGFEAGAGFDAASLLSNGGSPVSLDLDLKTKSRSSGASLSSEDTAFQSLNVVNSMKLIPIPQVNVAGKALSEAGIDLQIGANIKQQSFFNITGFEVDFDNVKNGNEKVISVNGGNISFAIPTAFLPGQEFKIAPTLKPIVSFWNEFSFAAKSELGVNLVTIGKNLTDKWSLPDWAKEQIKGALPKISYKDERTLPYTPPIKTTAFNPYANAVAKKLGDISIRV